MTTPNATVDPYCVACGLPLPHALSSTCVFGPGGNIHGAKPGQPILQKVGQSEHSGAQTQVVDLETEKVDWSRHAFRIGIDPQSFNCLDASASPNWNTLTVEEVAWLERTLGLVKTPGLRAVQEWAGHVLKWHLRRGGR